MSVLRSSSLTLVLALLAVCLGSGTARSQGTIVTDGSSIAAGTVAPGGTAGTVTTDSDAGPKTPPAPPSIAALGAIGTMNGTIPAFPGSGSGSLGAFSAPINTSATLAGGTYDYTSYTVSANAVVTYSGAVTIRTTGDVEIDGQVTSTATGASITFLCGGNFAIPANQYGTTRDGIRATGLSAPVTVDAAGSVTAWTSDTSRSEIRSFFGNVTVLSHFATGGITLSGADVRSPTGATVRALGFVLMNDAVLDVSGGAIDVQAFGGAVVVGNSTVDSFGDLTLEGAQGIAVTGGSDVHGEGIVTLKAFGDPVGLGGDDVVIDASSVTDFSAAPKLERLVAAGSNLSILSGAGVRLVNSAYVDHEGTGDVVITAFGKSVALEVAGSGQQSEVSHGGTGDVRISAQHDVTVAGSSLLVAANGRVDVRAAAGSFTFAGDGVIEADTGAVDIRAGDAVTVAANASTGPTLPAITGTAFSVGAGATGLDLAVSELTATAGTGLLVASGPVKLRGPVTSTDALTVRSVSGKVDVAGASLTTADDDTKSTSSVLVETFGGTQTIDATNATIRSGDSGGTKSGNVTLAVRSVPGPVVDAFFLPAKVGVRLNAKDATKSVLTASGVFDTGSVGSDLSGAATLTVGDSAVPITLVANKRGVLRSKDANLDFQILPAKNGTSKASFKLKRTGDVSSFLDEKGSGLLLLELSNASVDAKGAVTLAAGAYAFGKKRGALVEPSLYALKTQAKTVGNGLDSLQLVIGFATDGTTPETAPTVRIAIGGTFDVRIPSEAFGAAVKDRYVALSPAPGVSSVVLDYKRETLTLKGTSLDLGSFPAGKSPPVTIAMSIGADNRSVDVRMVRRDATSLGY